MMGTQAYGHEGRGIWYTDGAWLVRFLCLPFETQEEKKQVYFEEWPGCADWTGETLASTVKRTVKEMPQTYEEWLNDPRWDGIRTSRKTDKPFTEDDWNVAVAFLREHAELDEGFMLSW